MLDSYMRYTISISNVYIELNKRNMNSTVSIGPLTV